MNPAIEVENLSKLYRVNLGSQPAGMGDLRDALARAVSGTLYRLRHGAAYSHTTEEFWALKDISFRIEPGKVLGVIGHNGAGKSTLLKILSRITEPTSGRARIRGQVASLLEVGTGFHPELSGRENVFLNGSVLGMKRSDIVKNFDEIVSFAGIEKFIDTPVKRYSSGMRVRLAFAVAAHLQPEILIIDEVLAVGDAQFQQKCMGKMGDVARSGRTILFVSHNLFAVQALCDEILWLDRGQVRQAGEPSEVIPAYMNQVVKTERELVWPELDSAPGNERVSIGRVAVAPPGGTTSDPIYMNTPINVQVDFFNHQDEAMLDVTVQFVTDQEVIAFPSSTLHKQCIREPLKRGWHQATCFVPANLLNHGVYRLRVMIVADQSRVDYRLNEILSFEVLDSSESRGAWFGKRAGAVHPILDWSLETTEGPVAQRSL